jgi:hypothetical protein
LDTVEAGPVPKRLVYSRESLLENAVAGYLDEVQQVREMLDSRYDDLASGRIQGIDGEEAFRLLMEKTQVRRYRRISVYRRSSAAQILDET